MERQDGGQGTLDEHQTSHDTPQVTHERAVRNHHLDDDQLQPHCELHRNQEPEE